MFVWGGLLPILYRVDIQTGAGTVMEIADGQTVGWWPDVNGEPAIRILRAFGTLRFQRKQADGWKEFHRVAIKEMRERTEYEPVGPSADPGKYYVLARPPGRERTGVYLYDLIREDFGEPVVEHPTYDIFAAQVARDGTRLLSYCHVAHVRVCELSDPRADAHMKGLRKYFQGSANVFITDLSLDGNTFLLYVEGPTVAPSFYYYRVDRRKIEFIGFERTALFNKIAPIATAVNWKARDGRELSGYLTLPAGAGAARKLPLVVYPHGGPEARDRLRFDPWVQYLATRGYAVFQPNFRGSDGFGKSFAESGYGEWGRAMQNDITDGLAHLVQTGVADPARVCILGASYGGYAALAGVALTPDLYRCAISIAGVSDLSAYLKWYKYEYGGDSAGLAYWYRAIGDPDLVKHRLREVSPVHLADAIKADVLLIHGKEDSVVPYKQSVAMKRALDNPRRKIELIEIENEGHSAWSEENESFALERVHAFLTKSLGPGFEATPKPENDHVQ
jgi:dipeptidyl aminopeptidase/acylaminoacyl peptidase